MLNIIKQTKNSIHYGPFSVGWDTCTEIISCNNVLKIELFKQSLKLLVTLKKKHA